MIAIADHVVDLGPGAGTAGGDAGLRGHRRRAAGQRHAHRASPERPGRAEAVGAEAVRCDEGARRAARTTCKNVDVDIPLGVLVVVTGVAGSGKSSLIHGSVSGRDGVVIGRPDRHPWLATEQPGDLHRSARSDPQRVRESQRRQACPVQRQLRGSVSHLQRRGGDLHRPCDDGWRHHGLRGLRGPAVPGGGAGLPVRQAQHRRGAGLVGRGRGRLLRCRQDADAGRARDPAAHGRRRPRLPAARPTAHHAVGRRAAAAQARDAHG